MRRFGYFMLAFVPFIIVEGIQIFSVLFMLLFSSLFGIDDLDNLLMDESFNTMIMIIYTLITICVFGIWYYCCYEGEYIKNVGKKFNPLMVLGVLALIPGAQFASNYICVFIYLIKPDWWDRYEELMESSGLSEISFLIVLYAVILGPICEELIFRGLTLRMFNRSVSFWVANICQAVLFGIFHMNIVQGIYACALGILLGYICEKSGHIYYSIFMHILFNFWGTVISTLLSEISSSVFTELLIFVLTIVSFIIGFTLFHRGLSERDKLDETSVEIPC